MDSRAIGAFVIWPVLAACLFLFTAGCEESGSSESTPPQEYPIVKTCRVCDKPGKEMWEGFDFSTKPPTRLLFDTSRCRDKYTQDPKKYSGG